MTDSRLAEIDIVALRSKIKSETLPHMNSAEMKRRMEETLDLPVVRAINVTKEELEEFVLKVLSE